MTLPTSALGEYLAAGGKLVALNTFCSVCGAGVNAAIGGKLPKNARLIARHVGPGQHAPEVWAGMERIR